tara:strand:+ start:195 stop:521 length:327 start_codon:yes stop_codon:yes gene_type:complete
MHNFDYTYEFVSCETVPRSEVDSTPLVRSVVINVTAVDKADNSKTISLNEMKSLDYFYLQDADLPGSFIPIASVTNQNMIDWYKDGITSDDMDVYFTYKLYGVEDLDT